MFGTVQGTFSGLAHVMNSDLGKTGGKHPLKETKNNGWQPRRDEFLNKALV